MYLGVVWMVWYVAVLHLAWAFLMVFAPASLGATPVRGFAQVMPGWMPLVPAVLLAWSSLLAFAGMQALYQGRWLGMGMVLPQQIALTVTAVGAATAVLTQQYADGVPRPWAFILADQLPALLTWVCHGLAVLDHHRRRPRVAGKALGTGEGLPA